MIRSDWVNSSYNTDNSFSLEQYGSEGKYIIKSTKKGGYVGKTSSSDIVYSTDVIIADYVYKIYGGK